MTARDDGARARAWVLWGTSTVVQGLAAYPCTTNPGWHSWGLYVLSLLLMFGLAADLIDRWRNERIATVMSENARMQEQIKREAALFEILRKVGQR